MAIFKRLINTAPSRKASRDSLNGDFECGNAADRLGELSSLCWYPYKKLRRDLLRLVVFSEQGNRLLYDSETVISVNDRVVSCVRKSDCGGFQFLPHASDTSHIAKMVFGTMATSVKADSFKIHTLMNVDALMVSRLFSVSKPKSAIAQSSKCLASSISSDSDSQSHYSTVGSFDAIRDDRSRIFSSKTASHSHIDPPDGFLRLRNSSLQLDSKDIGDDLRAFSPNRLSRARRRQLSLKGLCDDGASLLKGTRSHISSCSSVNENAISQESVKQYGIALFFPGDDKDFVFQHILQIEQEIFKLIAQIHISITSRAHFLSVVYNAWIEFCSSICLLHNALRLKAPVWLSLTNPLLQNRTATAFCQILAKLSIQLNTKETKFFLSTLISSVLMNHLSWVASVVPPENCSYDRSLLLGTSVIDSRRNPYNAIAAQFMELSGEVGMGNISAKTVIFGNDSRLVAEILYILSYFVRCSSVENKRDVMTPDSLSPMKSFVEDSSIEGTSLNSLFSERLQSKNVSTNGKAVSPMATDSSKICDYNHEQLLLTPPPPKIRAIGTGSFSSNKHSPLPKQDSGISQKHYELIVDPKAMHESTSTKFPLAGTSASSIHLESDNAQPLYRASDFGRSLLAGVCKAYSPHFVLSGIDSHSLCMDEAQSSICQELLFDVSNATSIQQNVGFDQTPNVSSLYTLSTSAPFPPSGLKHLSSHDSSVPNLLASSPFSIGESYVASSQKSSHESAKSLAKSENKTTKIVITADCSEYVVKIISSNGIHVENSQVVSPSESVASMLEEFVELFQHKCVPTFLISFLEDRLSSLLAKSNVLVRLVSTADDPKCDTVGELSARILNQSNGSSVPLPVVTNHFGCNNEIDAKNFSPKCDFISMEHMSSILGCHCSDLRLILNVAAIYSPFVLSSVM